MEQEDKEDVEPTVEVDKEERVMEEEVLGKKLADEVDGDMVEEVVVVVKVAVVVKDAVENMETDSESNDEDYNIALWDWDDENNDVKGQLPPFNLGQPPGFQ